MSFSAPGMCHFLLRVSFPAPGMCHFLLQCLFLLPCVIYCSRHGRIPILFHLQNKNPTSVDDNSSSGDFPLAKVGCSREEGLIFRFDATDPESINILFLHPAVCAARGFIPRFESPASASKVEQKPVLRIPKGAHTKHRHVPTSRRPIGPTGMRLYVVLGTWKMRQLG